MQIAIIPKTNDEFVRHWRPYVAERVSFRLPPSQREDVTQHVLLRLIESNFLAKFWTKAETAMPIRVTGEAAAAMLGLSWEAWVAAVSDPEVRDHLSPVRGSKNRTEPGTLWLTKRVLHGAAEGWLPSVKITMPRCGHTEVVITHFRSMLNVTVGRHISNWFRLQSRRFDREIPLSDFEMEDDESSDVSLPTRVQAIEWETPLDTVVTGVEVKRLEVQVRKAAARAKLNPDIVWPLIAAGYTVKECVKAAVGEPALKQAIGGMDILKAIEQGQTLREAIGVSLHEAIDNLNVDNAQVHSRHQILRLRLRG